MLDASAKATLLRLGRPHVTAKQSFLKLPAAPFTPRSPETTENIFFFFESPRVTLEELAWQKDLNIEFYWGFHTFLICKQNLFSMRYF